MRDNERDALDPPPALWVGNPPRDQQGRVWLRGSTTVPRAVVRWLRGGSRLLCGTLVAGDSYDDSPTNSTPAHAFEVLDAASLETLLLIVGPSRRSYSDISIGPDEKILVLTGRAWDDDTLNEKPSVESVDVLDLETGDTLASYEFAGVGALEVRWLTERVLVVSTADSKKALKRGRGRHQQIDLARGTATPINAVPDRAYALTSVDRLSAFDPPFVANKVSTVALRAPSGDSLALGRVPTMLMLRDQRGVVRAQRLIASSPQLLDFSPGGRWLSITGTEGSTVADARSGAILRSYDRPIIAFLRDEPLVIGRHEVGPYALETVDGRVIIRSEQLPRRFGGAVVVGDRRKCTIVGVRGERTLDLPAAASSVVAASVELDAVVAFDTDGQRAIVSNRGTFALPNETREALSFAFVPSVNLVWASYGSRPALRAYSTRSGALVKVLDLDGADRYTHAKEWPLANTFVVTSAGRAWHVDGASGEVLEVLAKEGRTERLAAWALCDDGVRIAQPGDGLSAMVFSIR
ncbi:MAG: hypothetical protein JNK05_22100 [Myxococcales bacterium]|nr:hypothetical protein [Myxococcales bacterium]